MRGDYQRSPRATVPLLYQLCPQFRSEHGRDEAAKWFELLAKSKQYELFVVPAPRTGIDQVAGGDSVEHDVVVPQGSLLWGVTSSSGLAAGFRFSVWNDQRLVTPRLNAQNLAGMSTGAAPNTTGAAIPYLLTPPYAVQGTGLMHVKIVNLGTETNGIQVVMFFAIPISCNVGRP